MVLEGGSDTPGVVTTLELKPGTVVPQEGTPRLSRADEVIDTPSARE